MGETNELCIRLDCHLLEVAPIGQDSIRNEGSELMSEILRLPSSPRMLQGETLVEHIATQPSANMFGPSHTRLGRKHNIIDDLTKVVEWRQMGLLSQEQFETLKERLLW